jgi:hypothetical protein
MCGLVPAGPQLVLQARLVVRHQLVQQEVRKYLRLRLDGIVTLGTPVHKHRTIYLPAVPYLCRKLVFRLYETNVQRLFTFLINQYLLLNKQYVNLIRKHIYVPYHLPVPTFCQLRYTMITILETTVHRVQHTGSAKMMLAVAVRFHLIFQ